MGLNISSTSGVGLAALTPRTPVLANDASTLDALRDPTATALRARASSDPKSVVKAAAKQFEALFMNQLMKSMRESTQATGMLDNAGTQMGTEMLDTQFANQMTGLRGGLGDVIARQLERQMAGTTGATAGTAASPGAAAAAAAATTNNIITTGSTASLSATPTVHLDASLNTRLSARMDRSSSDAAASAASNPFESIALPAGGDMSVVMPVQPGPVAAVAPAGAAGAAVLSTRSAVGGRVKPIQEDFLRRHETAARAAEAQTGIPATFMVAQAAHESGWGKREIRNTDGSASFNLFGIKAGASWKGKTTQVTTTEVVNGQPQKVVAKFRAYASYDESFRDYAQLMKNNPRYSKVVSASNTAQGFAQGLQRAGYATDPGYAAKITRVINTTLRMQRATLSTPQTLA